MLLPTLFARSPFLATLLCTTLTVVVETVKRYSFS